MGGTDGAAASMPLLPRRWQRVVEEPVDALVVSTIMEGAGGARLLVCRETTRVEPFEEERSLLPLL